VKELIAGRRSARLPAVDLGGKVRAVLQGRFHVTLDDAVALAVPVLRHRMCRPSTPRPKASRLDESSRRSWTHARGDAKKISKADQGQRG